MKNHLEQNSISESSVMFALLTICPVRVCFKWFLELLSRIDFWILSRTEGSPRKTTSSPAAKTRTFSDEKGSAIPSQYTHA